MENRWQTRTNPKFKAFAGVSADVCNLDAPYTRVSQADYCTMHLVRNVSRCDVPTFGTVKVLQEKCIPIRRVVLNVQKAADQCFHWAQERFSVSMVMDTRSFKLFFCCEMQSVDAIAPSKTAGGARGSICRTCPTAWRWKNATSCRQKWTIYFDSSLDALTLYPPALKM